jgi:hypothetical protein
MNITNPLPGSLTLEYQDEEWVHTIDYEHIPFICRKFHEHGHLFRDFPQNPRPNNNEGTNEKPKDGFMQLQGRKRNPTKKNPSGTFLEFVYKQFL